MTSQERNELRPFQVTIIYMVEERTRERVHGLYAQLRECGIDVFIFSDDMTLIESHAAEMQKKSKGKDLQGMLISSLLTWIDALCHLI